MGKDRGSHSPKSLPTTSSEKRKVKLSWRNLGLHFVKLLQFKTNQFNSKPSYTTSKIKYDFKWLFISLFSPAAPLSVAIPLTFSYHACTRLKMSSVHFRRMNVLVKAASQAEIPKLFLLFLCGHRFGSLSNQPRHITFQNSFMGLSGLFQTSLSINRFRNSSSTRVVKVYRKKLNYNYPVQSRMKNISCQRKPTKHEH